MLQTCPLQGAPVGRRGDQGWSPGALHFRDFLAAVWETLAGSADPVAFVFRASVWGSSEPSSLRSSRITLPTKTSTKGWTFSRPSQTMGDTSPTWRKSWVGATLGVRFLGWEGPGAGEGLQFSGMACSGCAHAAPCTRAHLRGPSGPEARVKVARCPPSGLLSEVTWLAAKCAHISSEQRSGRGGEHPGIW